VSWSGARTVTWNIAGTSGSPINAANVNIHLSTNGGNTFTFLLATNEPNDGSASVVLPNLNSTQARIRVQGAGNIFYDVSDVNFTVSPGSAVPLVQNAGAVLTGETCTPTNGVMDPFETVTVNWSLQNVGSAPTTNLTATLLTSNGVYYPSAPQNYGAIAAAGTVVRSFSFVPAGVCGGSVTGVVQLADGGADMGTISTVFNLGGSQATVVTQVFANAGSIAINDFAVGTPYPSTIAVAGVSNVIKATATLNGLTHDYPDDVGILLAGPGSQTVVLMDSCGDGFPVAGINVTFNDSAASAIPNSTQIFAGSYRPAHYGPAGNYPLPAPATYPYGTNVTALGVSPNGTWSLYAVDWATIDDGFISGGWSITLISSNAVQACCTSFPAPSFTSTTYSNGVARFNWSALPGPHYQVQYRTNLTLGAWANLGASLLGTNTTMGITDSVTNSPMRFYRVMVGP
jgi:hypothetical protein